MTDSLQERIEATGDQLRAKIGGKVQSATFLAGITIALLGVEINGLFQNVVPLGTPVAISLLFFALILFIRAILKLDSLTMPKGFWSKDDNSSPIAYLTEDDLRWIKERMVFIWKKFVVIGLYTSVVSVPIMLVPITGSPSKDVIEASFVLSIVGFIAAAGYMMFVANEDRQRASRHSGGARLDTQLKEKAN